MRLMRDLLLVKVDTSENVSASGLYLGKKRYKEGIVSVVGQGMKGYEMKSVVGDRVRFSEHVGVPIEVDGEGHVILSERHEVLLRIKNENRN